MEYYCEVYQVLDSVPENPLLPGDNQYFNVKIEFENLHMSDDVNFEHYCYTIDHTVFNIPKEAIEQETFMVLSHLGVPEDARDLVAEKILAWIHEDVNDDDWAEEESIVDPGHCLVHAFEEQIGHLVA